MAFTRASTSALVTAIPLALAACSTRASSTSSSRISWPAVLSYSRRSTSTARVMGTPFTTAAFAPAAGAAAGAAPAIPAASTASISAATSALFIIALLWLRSGCCV